MKLSRETRRQARELFDLALVNGRIDDNRVRQIVDGVVASKPRAYLALLKELTRLVRLEAEKHHAIIESASALDAAETKKLDASLRSRFGEITTEFRENPALISGIRIKIGSDVWDNSVAARLQALEQQL